MKKYFSKDDIGVIVKLLINQIGIAIIAFTVSTAAEFIGGDIGLLIACIFSILFYLVLLYFSVWEAGAKDRIKADLNRIQYLPVKGMVLSLMANIPNLIIAFLILISNSVEGAETLEFISRFIASILESMYNIVVIYMNTVPLSFFLIIIPAVVVCFVGYILGYKNIRISSLLGIKTKTVSAIEAHNKTLEKYHAGDGSDSIENENEEGTDDSGQKMD